MDKTAEKILLKYNPSVEDLLPALKDISAIFGYVSKKDAKKAADYFSVPLSKIYETATFYDLISAKKQPLLVIKVCSSTNCVVNNSFAVIKEIENFFHLKAGDENNPKIKLETISCLGRCGEGPVMAINNKIYTQVTASSVHEILKEWM